MMKKIIVMLLVLCAALLGGCSEQNNTNQSAKTDKVAAAQQKPAKNISFIVYRAAADGSEKLLPEKITLPANDKSLPENALIALVSTKPQDARMDDVVPIGTKVLSLKIDKNGTAYADFSKELAKKGQGSYGEMMLCYAITNTLTEFKEIKRVQILVEGKKVITLSGHMDVEDPLERNKTLL